MTAARHPSVRVSPADPCPFCGCGLALAGHAARPRKSHPRRMRYRGPAITWEELPPEWQAVMRSKLVRRDETDAERKYVAAINARAGWRAIIDERSNKITGWERPDTGEKEVAA